MADAEYARFESMKNADLRAELKRRGCSTTGIKKDLLAKLRVALQKQNEQPIVPPVVEQIDPVMELTEQISIESERNSSMEENLSSSLVNTLDTSNTVVSKSHEKDERNVQRIGDDTHLPSIGSIANAKTESVIKEISSVDEQQQIDQSKMDQTIENKNIEVLPSLQIPSEPIEQKEIPKENEGSKNHKEAEKPPLVSNRSQQSSLSKISNRSTVNKMNITSELLRTLISDLTLLPESVVNAELDSEENSESIVETTDDLPTDSMTIGELADQKHPSNRIVAIDDFSARKKVHSHPTRLSSFESKSNDVLTDEPVRVKEAMLTHEPPSEILYIRGLTRPFSLMQLKGLLSRYGKIVERGFWLDRIKSQCFVTYQTLDEAQNAREKLDGCRWPSTNPKALSIRYAREEEFEYSRIHDLPPDHMSTDSTDRVVEESTHPMNNAQESKNDSDQTKLPKEKPSGFLITDEEENEEPVKSNDKRMKGGLDDYFRKTQAKPCIYWLPLTDEQIIERARRHAERNAERDEEQRKREIDGRTDKRKRSVSPSRRDSKRH